LDFITSFLLQKAAIASQLKSLEVRIFFYISICQLFGVMLHI
jgi:hypothetical protein